MKKLVLLVLCVVVCMSFVGCILEDNPQKEASNKTQTTTSTKEDVFGLNETAVFNTLKFTALEIKESSGTEFFAPEEGKTFVGVKFEIENISKEDQAVSTLLLFEGYVDDIKCDYSISASVVFDEGTLDGTVAPGKKLVGWYALELPKDWSELELDVQSNWLSNSDAKFVFENK